MAACHMSHVAGAVYALRAWHSALVATQLDEARIIALSLFNCTYSKRSWPSWSAAACTACSTQIDLAGAQQQAEQAES